MVKSWIHSSVATLESHKSESRAETNCNKHKGNTIEVILEWFLTTRTAATTSRISLFTLSLLKIRDFFLMFTSVCFLNPRKWKRYRQTVFFIVNYSHRKAIWAKSDKLRYWKIVANEKCTEEIGEFSSVKNLFWGNHESKKARKSPKRMIYRWTKFHENVNCSYSVILENQERIGQKSPKKPKNVKTRSFSLVSKRIANRNQPQY